MSTLTCKHKIWRKNWLYLRPYLKAFPVFNVLETCRVYLLTIDLGIVKFIKTFFERLFEKCEICRHGGNAAECKLIIFFLLAIAQGNSPRFFCTQFSMESNHYEMKPRFQSLSFS